MTYTILAIIGVTAVGVLILIGLLYAMSKGEVSIGLSAGAGAGLVFCFFIALVSAMTWGVRKDLSVLKELCQ